jgi:hypothetical protein
MVTPKRKICKEETDAEGIKRSIRERNQKERRPLERRKGEKAGNGKRRERWERREKAGKVGKWGKGGKGAEKGGFDCPMLKCTSFTERNAVCLSSFTVGGGGGSGQINIVIPPNGSI